MTGRVEMLDDQDGTHALNAERRENEQLQADKADAFRLVELWHKRYDERGVELEQLKARLADAEGEGCTLHGHAKHGKEAEELRKGVEKLLATRSHAVPVGLLHRLLDSVDARDSLAHLRANDEMRGQKKTITLLHRELAAGKVEAMEALIDTIDGAEVGSDRIRRILVALGCKRKDLPKDIPSAGGKRGRR